VGKGTQAALLVDHFGARQLSSGDIFRKEICEGTELGCLAKTYMDRGELVPNEVTIGMMAKRLETDDIREHGFILDGFPRSVEQAVALDDALEKLGIQLAKVVSIEVPDEVVVSRLSGRLSCSQCGEIYQVQSKPPKAEGVCDKCSGVLVTRADDAPETIRARLKVFADTTLPVIGYYADKGVLLRVDGSGDPTEIFKVISGKLQ
jgi:adenylate kinase